MTQTNKLTMAQVLKQETEGDQGQAAAAAAPKASLENYDDERAERTLRMLAIQKS